MAERPRVVRTRPTTGRRGRAIRRFRVDVIDGPSAGASWALPAERCAIGSHPSNDLVIDDSTVSRFHCELAIAGEAVHVRDLDSRNATFVGRLCINDGAVPGGTVLSLGNSDVKIEVDDAPTERALLLRTS